MAKQPEVNSVIFPDLVKENKEYTNNLGNLMDVPIEMHVELGRTTLTVKEILALGEGAIVELDKEANSNADIYVNNKLIAKGEIVVIDDYYAVRITEILEDANTMPTI
jgi:flagellar motor switch protein FliN/FliY